MLLDADGEVLPGGEGAVGPALPEERLREAPPEILRRELEATARRLALRPFTPDERVPFDALFGTVPAGAVSFSLVTVPLPEPEAAAATEPASGPSLPSSAE